MGERRLSGKQGHWIGPVQGKRDLLESLKRRRLLQGLGLSALASRSYALKVAPANFTHGVASGDPLTDRIILWTRVLPMTSGRRVEVTWQVAEDPGFSRVITGGETGADAESDYTVKVDATGLVPGTDYFYRFSAQGQTSPVGRTKTLPTDGVAEFRMGVASCSNYPQGFFNAYRHMADTDLDVVLHLGDYIYEYQEGRYANEYALDVLKRNVEPTHEILVLEDYRSRYALYRSDPDLQAVHQRHPFICVWDDHELTNDTWKDGAENHNQGEGDFSVRLQAARRAYHEWMPIRTHSEGDQGPIYRHFPIGDLADLIMLDTRVEGRDRGLSYSDDMIYRAEGSDASSPLNPDVPAFLAEKLNDPSRQLLGQGQEQWLSQMLKKSTGRGATWQVLGQQVLMSKVGIPRIDPAALEALDLPESERGYIDLMQVLGAEGLPLNLDAWDGYPVSRDRVTAMLKETGANTIALAGDTHNAWAFNLRDAKGQAIGVEIGAPSISSPGMEDYVPMTAQALAGGLKATSPGLIDVDVTQRGWAEVVLTPRQMRSRWHFVSTVLDRRFTVTATEEVVCLPGQRRFA